MEYSEPSTQANVETQNDSTTRSLHTPGPWRVIQIHGNNYVPDGTLGVGGARTQPGFNGAFVCAIAPPRATTLEDKANADLIAAAPEQYAEMRRYLPILERAEADPETWNRLTEGLGIATANGYRAVIAKAEGAPSVQEGNEKA